MSRRSYRSRRRRGRLRSRRLYAKITRGGYRLT